VKTLDVEFFKKAGARGGKKAARAMTKNERKARALKGWVTRRKNARSAA
jgi:hypothetical protein